MFTSGCVPSNTIDHLKVLFCILEKKRCRLFISSAILLHLTIQIRGLFPGRGEGMLMSLFDRYIHDPEVVPGLNSSLPPDVFVFSGLRFKVTMHLQIDNFLQI